MRIDSKIYTPRDSQAHSYPHWLFRRALLSDNIKSNHHLA